MEITEFISSWFDQQATRDGHRTHRLSPPVLTAYEVLYKNLVNLGYRIYLNADQCSHQYATMDEGESGAKQAAAQIARQKDVKLQEFPLSHHIQATGAGAET